MPPNHAAARKPGISEDIQKLNETPRDLKQLVIKPTVYCFHKCPYCDLRQDYYQGVLEKNKARVIPVRDTRTSTPGLEMNAKAAKINPGHMPLEMALQSIDEAAALGMESMQLSGGDPLLYPHLTEVIRAAARHPGVFVFMNSVGTQVSAAKVRELIDAGLMAWNFSIDTLDPALYEELRGVNRALEKIMAAIATVRSVAVDYPDFCINYMTVITNKNYRELPDLFSHCLETGVASIYLMNVYGDVEGRSLLSVDQIQEFRNDIVPEILRRINEKSPYEIVKTNAEWVMNTFFSSENSDENYSKGIYWPNPEAAKAACRTPEHYALIEPDGKVLPCCLVEISHEGEVGDMSRNSLTEVWAASGYSDFRRDRIDFCVKCSSPRNKTVGFVPKLCRQFNVFETEN
ncbi:radical SAM protein [Burkholderia multivorans]|uniref:radical SAM protein n=1 Tax=Burkholderia multivorans TaxID=87883 RepID=UPI00027820A6|nr:radical SAM protein [Burkholderia multivorans]EJO53958.1 hypothetical protein BURMUCF2_A1993 [Burkholderia multivorans CF2]MBU9474630.1 radical SAM protein [Burkholderia multivorans]